MRSFHRRGKGRGEAQRGDSLHRPRRTRYRRGTLPSAGFRYRENRGREEPGRVPPPRRDGEAVSYTHLRAHETRHDLVCRLLLEKKKKNEQSAKKAIDE